MNDETLWHATDARAFRDAEVISRTAIEVNGYQTAVDPGMNMKETIIRTAKDAGLGKFRVVLNGMEVKPSQAPDLFTEGDQVKLVPYDVAG